MKLIEILSGKIIVEVSEKLKKQLVDKFKTETQDSENDILKYIQDFERFKQFLPVDKRDITRYDYKTLKSFIDTKENTKTRKEEINSAITNFIKKEKDKPSLDALKLAVKKFYEIQSEIEDLPKDINKYSFLKLTQFLEKNYEDLLIKKLINKFKSENEMLTTEQILFYVTQYIQNSNDIPVKTLSADLMSFSEFEHLVDEIVAKQGLEKKTNTNLEDINLVYDDNDLKIYAPTEKEHCIRLAHGRRYCLGWLGGGNLYYNYRLTHGRTIYYVIDESLDYEDRYFVTVVLVDRNGGTAFADKTNSRPYAGDVNLSWDEISRFVPKLKNLRDLFVYRPLSEDEIEMRDQYRNIRYDRRHQIRLPNNQTPMEYFDSPREVGLWMEINSPQLFDEDYADLTPDLKKKYIALGLELTPAQIASSEATVLNYLVKKNIAKIETNSLSQMTPTEIALLNTPPLQSLKEKKKEQFALELTNLGGQSRTLDIMGLGDGNLTKFMSLYGLDEIFNSLPKDLEEIKIDGKGKLKLNIPPTIGKFKKLQALVLIDCIQSLPEEVCELVSLKFLTLQKNPELKTIPNCVGSLPDLLFINVKESNNFIMPQSIQERGSEWQNGLWEVSQ